VVVGGLTKFVRLYSTKSSSTREVITALKVTLGHTVGQNA